MVVNGGRHSLDLVALIAYFKLKKRCQGLCHSPSSRMTNYCTSRLTGHYRNTKCCQFLLSNTKVHISFTYMYTYIFTCLQVIKISVEDSVNWFFSGKAM